MEAPCHASRFANVIGGGGYYLDRWSSPRRGAGLLFGQVVIWREALLFSRWSIPLSPATIWTIGRVPRLRGPLWGRLCFDLEVELGISYAFRGARARSSGGSTSKKKCSVRVAEAPGAGTSGKRNAEREQWQWVLLPSHAHARALGPRRTGSEAGKCGYTVGGGLMSAVLGVT